MYLGWVNTYSQVSQFGQFRKHTARQLSYLVIRQITLREAVYQVTKQFM